MLSATRQQANRSMGTADHFWCQAVYAVDGNSLCSPALLKEKEKTVFLSSLLWGQGKEATFCTLYHHMGLSRESQIWENIWIRDHGRLFSYTQHSNCRSVVKAPTPALHAKFAWFRKVGKMEVLALWCCFFPSQDTAQWLWQPRKHTYGRGALKTSLPFSSPSAFSCLLFLLTSGF